MTKANDITFAYDEMRRVGDPPPSMPNVRYLKKLGEGCFGTVFKAFDELHKIEIAIKQVQRIPDLDSVVAESVHWLQVGLHWNVVNCYLVQKVGRFPYIFMEYVPHGSLADWIRDGKLLDLPSWLQVAYQLATGLSYVHSKGVLHQDVKPENVLMDFVEGALLAKISDFTVSSKLDPNGNARWNCCDERFASPEQLGKSETITVQSDVWGWAVTVLRLVAGLPELHFDSGLDAPAHLEKLDKSAKKTLAWKGLHQLLRSCLSRDPAGRPESMQSVAERVRELFWEETGTSLKEIRIDPIVADAMYENNKGVSYSNIARYDEALRSFEQATENFPNHLTAIYNQLVVRWTTGRLSDDAMAINGMKNRLGDPVQDAAVHSFLGRLFWIARRHEEAVCSFLAARSLSSTDPTVEQYLIDLERNNLQFFCQTAILEGHSDEIRFLCASRRSPIVLSGSKDGTIRVWNIDRRECLAAIPHPSELTIVACVDADGTFAATMDHEGVMRIWDLEKRACVSSFTIAEDTYGTQFHVGFLGEHPLLVTADLGPLGGFTDPPAKLHVWNWLTGTCLETATSHAGHINSLTVAPDCFHWVTTGSDNLARIWHWVSARQTIVCVASVEGSTRYGTDGNAARRDSIEFADLDSSNRLLLAGCNDGSIILHDTLEGKRLGTLRGHTATVRCVRWVEEGQFAVSSSDSEIKIWDTRARIGLSTFVNPEGLGEFSIVQHRRALVTSVDSVIQLWQLGQLSQLRQELVPDRLTLAVSQIRRAEAVRQDIEEVERLIVTDAKKQAYERLLHFKTEHKNFQRHAHVRKLLARFGKEGRKVGVTDMWLDGTISLSTGCGCAAVGLSVSPNGREVLVGTRDGVLCVADAFTKIVTNVVHSESQHGYVRFLDAQRVVTGQRDGGIEIRNLRTMELEVAIPGLERIASTVASIDYCERSGHVAAVANSMLGRSCTVWNLRDKTPLFVRKWDDPGIFQHRMPGGFSTVGLSEGGASLVLGGVGGELTVWDVERNELMLDLRGHRADIVFAAFYDHDAGIVSVSKDSIIRVWDTNLGRSIWHTECDSNATISCCVVRQFGLLVVLHEQNVVEVWNLVSRCCEYSRRADVQPKLNHIGATPDGQYLLASDQNDTVWIWGLDWKYSFDSPSRPSSEPKVERSKKALLLPDGSEVRPFVSCGHSGDISTLFSAGARYLLSGGHDATVRVWDVLHGATCIRTFTGHGAVVSAVGFTSDGRCVVAGSLDKEVICWTFESGDIERKLTLDSAVRALVATSDSSVVVIGCDDGTICRWDMAENSLKTSLPLEGTISSLVIPTGANYVVAGSAAGELALLDLHTMALARKVVKFTGTVRIQERDANVLYVADSSGQFSVVQVEPFAVLKRIPTQEDLGNFFVYDSCLVTTCGGLSHWMQSDLVVQDLESGNVRHKIQNIGMIRALAGFPIGYACVGLAYGNIVLVRLSDGAPAALLRGVDDRIKCVKISSNQRYVASGYRDCLRIYDLESGGTVKWNELSGIIDVDFSADSRTALARTKRGDVIRVDLSSMSVLKDSTVAQLGNVNAFTLGRSGDSGEGEADCLSMVLRDIEGVHFYWKGTLSGPGEEDQRAMNGALGRLGFRYTVFGPLSSESSELAVDQAVFFDMKAERGKANEPICFRFSHDQSDGTALALVSEDGLRLVTIGSSGTINLWEIASQRLIRTIRANSRKEARISCATMYNANIVVVGCSDGTIEFWNIHTGAQCSVIDAHAGRVTWVSTSPDRTLVLSGGATDGVRFWSAANSELVASLVVLDDDKYVLQTPEGEFFASDPRCLMFNRVTRKGEATRNILVADEKELEHYRETFIDLGGVRGRIFGRTDYQPAGGSEAAPSPPPLNRPCPCGSNKEFADCHGKIDNHAPKAPAPSPLQRPCPCGSNKEFADCHGTTDN